ncbi:MAG: hypothetical protein QF704_00455 [Anaerolineales bacterium]|nr:hypothetical protein [Anaerolineales bacterium]
MENLGLDLLGTLYNPVIEEEYGSVECDSCYRGYGREQMTEIKETGEEFCDLCYTFYKEKKMENKHPIPEFDKELGEHGEFVVKSAISGREYFGLTSEQALDNMNADDAHYLRKRAADLLTSAARNSGL